jgi:3-oxoadipate enol-lactonase
MPEFATANGGLHYDVLGPDDGRDVEWITLLHNFMSTGQAAWGIIAEALADRYRVLLPDLPGHGRSLGQPAAFHHLEMGRQIADLMRHVGAEQGHVAGCSSGGMIAGLIVQHRLATPATLTLVSSTYSVNPSTTGAKKVVHPKDFRASRKWMDATARLHDAYRYDGYFEDVLLNRFQRLQPERVIDLPLDALKDWTLPVCIVHGSEDEFFPVGIASQMEEALPDAELHIVPGQGHGLIFRRPGRVQAIMAEFLARHPILMAI